ncbi:MAG: hypothetical protein MI741_16965, partial [Rhodospirillales bacterium]|nr:hypothetical protein [Rhodospirillales bacterium]
SVAYKLKKSDRNRKKHLLQNHSEEDVANFENQPITMKMTDILTHFEENNSGNNKTLDITSLRKSVFEKRGSLWSFGVIHGVSELTILDRHPCRNAEGKAIRAT